MDLSDVQTFNVVTILSMYTLTVDIFDTFSVTKKIVQDVIPLWLRWSITFNTCLRDALFSFIILDWWRIAMWNFYRWIVTILRNVNARSGEAQHYYNGKCNRPVVRIIFNIFAFNVLILLICIIDFFFGIIDLFVSLYKNFSFPLLFLIIVILFRKEISDLLKRTQEINLENSSGKVSFYFSELVKLNSEIDAEKNFMLRHYGEGSDPHLGAGPGGTQNSEFEYYLALIYANGKVHEELGKKGPFEVIKDLHNAYFFLTENRNLKNDNPTKVIQNFYDSAMKMREAGGKTVNDEFVYNYSYFVRLSLNLLNERLGIKPNDNWDEGI